MNYKKNSKKHNTWRLKNMLINNHGSLKKSKRKFKKYLKTSKNGNTTIQKLWNAAKAVLRGKFIAIKNFPRKQEKFQTL